MLVMPLFFLSGGLYPLRGLPAWLAVLEPSVTRNGWPVPVGLSPGIVAVTGVALPGMAIAEFQRTE